MKVNLHKEFPIQKPISTKGKDAVKKVVTSEYNVTRGFLILSSETKNACDSKKTYYINHDGSGKVVTGWGSEEYKPETFNPVLASAKKISEKNDSVIFSQDEIEGLINEAEEQISAPQK